MAVNSSTTSAATPSHPALPPTVIGLNVNFCKNPTCKNFGVPANIVKFRRRTGALSSTPGTAYGLAGVTKKRPGIKCLLCGETFSMKSNLAVAEELTRFAKYLLPADRASCPNDACANHAVPAPSPEAYYRFGQTNAGTPRYRCKLCKRTFSTGGRALKKQRITHFNKTILLSLTNKMPIRRIAKVTGLNAVTLYGKIDFLHRQCLAFAADKERALLELALPRLYLSTDRQDYMVNWSRDTDRRNVVLHAIGTADNTSGYVFGMHLNFDPEHDPEVIDTEAKAIDDLPLPYPHRKYARLWLAADYADAQAAVAAEKVRMATKAAKGPLGGKLSDSIADAYDAAAIREDSEVSDERHDEGNRKLPDAKGVQVHEEYSMYGHFQFLKNLLRRVEKLRFFLDQDSGMRAACFAAFSQDIKARRVDAFFVRLTKEMTVDKKRAALASAKAGFKAVQDAAPGLEPRDIERIMMKVEIARSVVLGKWSDRWCMHPMPNMSEPRKAMCWLTDLGDYDEDHTARLFLKASLAGIDNFFQRVRRSINPLERPLLTASKNRRTWYGYSPYNPAMVEKLLDIYRVMHNFVETGKDGKTPAMRMGLVRAGYTPEDVLYFAH